MKTKLDLPTLKQIISNKFDYDSRHGIRLSGRLNEILGTPTEDRDAKKQLQETVYKTMVVVLTDRLMKNDHSVPLFSVNDFDQMIEDIVSQEISFNEMIDYEDSRLEAVKLIKSILASFIDIALEVIGEGDPYDVYWRLVNIIVEIANDELIPPTSPLGDDRYDEVTRRMFTREEYLAQTKLIFSAISDPEKIVRILLDPILDSLDLDQFELAEVEKELREQVMPEFKPQFEKMISAIQIVTKEEVDRLYS